jgi:hypothetical protein
MMQKKILRPDRLRQVPAQFSWIDQRLVRENFLRQGRPEAWALSLVLAPWSNTLTVSQTELAPTPRGW